MVIIVCGPRDWQDHRMVDRALHEAISRAKSNEPITVIQGGAKGADFQAKSIAEINGWNVETFNADWRGPCQLTCRNGHRRTYRNSTHSYCPAAGDYRNKRMAEYQPKPFVCLAMIAPCLKDKCEDNDVPRHMTHGTADMIREAKKNGIPVVPFGEVDLYVK